jgi:hypothetical protein
VLVNCSGLQECDLQTRNSDAFAALLVGVLWLGNYLNLGTTNGDAVAFKLQALTKLGDTKSIDGDQSLLSFLAKALIDAGQPPLADQIPAVIAGEMETSVDVRPLSTLVPASSTSRCVS